MGTDEHREVLTEVPSGAGSVEREGGPSQVTMEGLTSSTDQGLGERLSGHS